MLFLRKSLLIRLFLGLMAVAVLMGAEVYYFYVQGFDAVPLNVFVISLLFFIVLMLLIVWFDVARPLRVVLAQMQALLAGHAYKRIYTKRVDEIGILGHFFNRVVSGLGAVSQRIVEGERMLDELTIASDLQRDILPKESITLPGLQIVAKTKPATEVGGDSFDFVTAKGKTYIYIGDATGHGVPAGLLMTMVNAFVDVFADAYESSYKILVNVNKYLKMRVEKAMFMTLVMLAWDHKTQKMTYTGAGHEHILIYHVQSGECEAIKSGGVALGMVPDNSKLIKETDLPLQDGDFVVLYSDGITEALNDKGERYGLENLKAALVEYAPRYGAEGLNYHLAKDVGNFVGNSPQADDMTLIVIQHKKDLTGQEKIKDKGIQWSS